MLLRDWYCNLTSQVKLGSYMSEPFAICRGICQGSILSPMLFNLVMDPLLSEMRSKSLGISINGLLLGAFVHADYLQTMDATKQATFVNSFTICRGFHLCLDKCALLQSSNNPLTSSLKIDVVTSLPHEKSVKCLSVWENSTLSHACIKERIQKACAEIFPMVN